MEYTNTSSEDPPDISESLSRLLASSNSSLGSRKKSQESTREEILNECSHSFIDELFVADEDERDEDDALNGSMCSGREEESFDDGSVKSDDDDSSSSSEGSTTLGSREDTTLGSRSLREGGSTFESASLVETKDDYDDDDDDDSSRSSQSFESYDASTFQTQDSTLMTQDDEREEVPPAEERLAINTQEKPNLEVSLTSFCKEADQDEKSQAQVEEEANDPYEMAIRAHKYVSNIKTNPQQVQATGNKIKVPFTPPATSAIQDFNNVNVVPVQSSELVPKSQSFASHQTKRSSSSSSTHKVKNIPVEEQVNAIYGAVSSNVSSMEESKRLFGSYGSTRATHANDILVEIEAFTIESRHLMNRPGLRCPASLPVPISTVGVDCIGRVVQSSPHAALNGILFRDRICAIYPFEYQPRRVWNTNRGCAHVDAAFTVKIPNHVDAAEAVTVLHVYCPAFQSLLTGMGYSIPTAIEGPKRYGVSQLEGQKVLIQNGCTEMGLALIELSLGLGAEEVYATGSCVHHSTLRNVGATPLGLVEKRNDEEWELWKTLQEEKSIGLVILQEMPSVFMLDMFMSVLDGRMGSVVLMGGVQHDDDQSQSVGEGNEENIPPSMTNQETVDMSYYSNLTETVYSNEEEEDVADLLDTIEKARVAHEKVMLEQRLESTPELITYNGVMASIIEDPLAWKEDVTFLISLLANGTIKPRVKQRVYSQEEVPEIQDEIEEHGKKESIVCLPSRKWSVDLSKNSSVRTILGNCSTRTKSESQAVTKISSGWRKFACQKSFRCTIEASKRVDAIIHQRREDSATLVQLTWRIHSDKKRYAETIRHLVMLQYLVRRWLACCVLSRLREEKDLREAGASTKIATVWRRLHCMREYSRNVRDIVICQSTVRRKHAMTQRALLKAQRIDMYAKLIQAEWEASVARRRVNKILLSMRHKRSEFSAAIILQAAWRRHFVEQYFYVIRYQATVLQASVRKMMAVDRYKRTVVDVTTCQNAVRKYQAVQKVEAMKFQRDLSIAKSKLAELKCCDTILKVIQYRRSAYTIQKTVRGWIARQLCKKEVKDIITCQSVALRYLAVKKINTMRRELACAKLLQTWARGFIALRCFTQYKAKIVSIQASVRKSISRSQYVATIKAAKVFACAARVYLAVQRLKKLRKEKTMYVAAENLMRIKACITIERIGKFRHGAIRMQTAARGWLARRQLKHDMKYVIVCQAIMRGELVRKKTQGLQSYDKFWKQEAVQSNRVGETHVTTKTRHTAARKIQTTFTNYYKRHHVDSPAAGSLFSSVGLSESLSDDQVVAKGVRKRPCSVNTAHVQDGYSGKCEESTMPNSQFSPSSLCSCMEEKDFADFVSAVVVIQTYIHDNKEKKTIDATFTEIDQFEYENFYKPMLYGVDDPADAIKRIVVCQSAVRRMIAKKKSSAIQKRKRMFLF